MDIEIFVEICREGVILPEYAKPGDSGMDICAAEDVIIRPGETVIVPTGLKVAIPEGYEIQVRPRSGISLRTPLRITNSPGTIDSGYRDEIGIIVTNSSSPARGSASHGESKHGRHGTHNKDKDEHGHGGEELITIDNKENRQGTYLIKKGDRIAQIVLQKVPRMKFTIVDSVKHIGMDRGGGFGSTGV
ncbi:MAG: dUTP diphosphatase [Clostridiaceae bacterium]|nr:dUTP diphosphatase [Clostridiaceae bacterium]